MQTKTRQILIGLMLALMASGCANRHAAKLGNVFGRAIGKPVGFIATTLDETFRTSSKIVAENLRDQRERRQNSRTASRASLVSADRQPTEPEPAAEEWRGTQLATSNRPQSGTDSEFWE